MSRRDIDQLITAIERDLERPKTGPRAFPDGILPVSQELAARRNLDALRGFVGHPYVSAELSAYAQQNLERLERLLTDNYA